MPQEVLVNCEFVKRHVTLQKDIQAQKFAIDNVICPVVMPGVTERRINPKGYKVQKMKGQYLGFKITKYTPRVGPAFYKGESYAHTVKARTAKKIAGATCDISKRGVMVTASIIMACTAGQSLVLYSAGQLSDAQLFATLPDMVRSVTGLIITSSVIDIIKNYTVGKVIKEETPYMSSLTDLFDYIYEMNMSANSVGEVFGGKW